MGTNGFSNPQRTSEVDRNVGPMRLGEVLGDLLAELPLIEAKDREAPSHAVVAVPTANLFGDLVPVLM